MYITELDKYIGKKIREIRQKKGVLLSDLIKEMGIKRTQMFKYENGINRISASKIFIVAKVLNESVYKFVPEEYRHVEKPREEKKQVERKKNDN